MKISRAVFTVAAITCVAFAARIAMACDAVFVESSNGTTSGADVTLGLNAMPVDSLTFSLTASQSRIDTLSVGAGSPDLLTLKATVSQNGMTAQCQTQIVNQNNTTQCSGVVDPKLMLVINSTMTSSGGTSGSSGGSTDGGSDGSDGSGSGNMHVHHDNGKHLGVWKGAPAWGFLCQVLGHLVNPPTTHGIFSRCAQQSGSDGGSDGSGGTTTPPTSGSGGTSTPTLSCQLVPTSSF